MKKRILGAVLVYCLLPTVYSQVKITKATSQKTIAGTGGVFMKYMIEFKDKKNAVLQIDSVKSIADGSMMTHFIDKNEISFGFSLVPPEKCRTCTETTPPQANLTKGVIIYYRRGEKKSACKVKKFVELGDIIQP